MPLPMRLVPQREEKTWSYSSPSLQSTQPPTPHLPPYGSARKGSRLEFGSSPLVKETPRYDLLINYGLGLASAPSGHRKVLSSVSLVAFTNPVAQLGP